MRVRSQKAVLGLAALRGVHLLPVTAADFRQRGIRRRKFERFITELAKQPGAVTEFDEALWGSLVEYMTVKKDKSMVFTLIGGTEMRA